MVQKLLCHPRTQFYKNGLPNDLLPLINSCKNLSTRKEMCEVINFIRRCNEIFRQDVKGARQGGSGESTVSVGSDTAYSQSAPVCRYGLLCPPRANFRFTS